MYQGSKTRHRLFFGSVTYLLWAGAVIAHGLLLWGSSASGTFFKNSYVVGLSTEGSHMNVTLGYSGICVYSSAQVQTDSDSGAISKCKGVYFFPDDDSESADSSNYGATVLKHFRDELDLEDDTTLDTTMLQKLLLAARDIKEKILTPGLAWAAFFLVLAAGLFAIFPLFFYLAGSRRTVCMWTMACAGLCMGFGLMSIGATFFTTQGTWALLNNDEELTSTLKLTHGDIVYSQGHHLKGVSVTALVLNGLFVLSTTLAAVTRNHSTVNEQMGRPRPPMTHVGAGKPLLGKKKIKFSRGKPALNRRRK
ncbi:hypothetical protein CGMCC3_g14934 [Colletotrichum fructicola]|uniref:Uncharacterized protein n=1 Tax=Colletotrichum fructicola (strain Nara gc5) TaxID=1213859 RepID=L2FJB5_COLFN|nr:uncharacterized protein CGMCC3_g14934 [Colletotrichum fructicola]KAF4477681.1 hypothetical protein CGGC5_v014077 [Colletotrichum fructicola Nara gc5]KAE9568936.1 hypothetical protein CGMCC3_g14934 [Colletotrichum fructicola]KAF4421203.1 hypothetical protein CFRS1_v015419 [Colletotrichum fructicola]KAF4883940.1 hypothetical protein CGCFRS4_v013106 [Colletotrichum fructicola]KAF4927278.1 hypothetical protein CGCF245_v013221 [Colletotrichum fructicola]